jgi:hypothetical protein
MICKVNQLFYNKHEPSNPEQIFAPGTYVKVNDLSRAKKLIERGIVVEAEAPKDTEIKVLNDQRKDGDPKSPEEQGDALEEMTVKELTEMARERGVEVPKKARKDEIIDLLK